MSKSHLFMTPFNSTTPLAQMLAPVHHHPFVVVIIDTALRFDMIPWKWLQLISVAATCLSIICVSPQARTQPTSVCHLQVPICRQYYQRRSFVALCLQFHQMMIRVTVMGNKGHNFKVYPHQPLVFSLHLIAPFPRFLWTLPLIVHWMCDLEQNRHRMLWLAYYVSKHCSRFSSMQSSPCNLNEVHSFSCENADIHFDVFVGSRLCCHCLFLSFSDFYLYDYQNYCVIYPILLPLTKLSVAFNCSEARDKHVNKKRRSLSFLFPTLTDRNILFL